MNKKGPIILIEDDLDDQELISEILKELDVANEIVMLNNGAEAYEFLNVKNIDPFLIISDINMPKMSGIALRDKMQQEGKPKLRKVPFLFMTTGTAEENIIKAYAHSVQGFFRKSPSFNDLKKTFSRIIEYWSECTEPSFV